MKRNIKPTRTGLLTIVILLSSATYLGVTLIGMNEKHNENEAKRRILESQVSAIQKTNDEMSHALENKDDPAVQQDIARNNGFINKEERIFIDIAD
ncbi:MAG: hypothetical protein R3Y07_03625 [Eubacteriales bacterium]